MAGAFKGDSLFSNFPIDLTLLFMGISIPLILINFIKKGHRLEREAIVFILLFLLLASFVLFSVIYAKPQYYGLDKALRLLLINGWIIAAPLMFMKEESFRRLGYFIVFFTTAASISFIFTYITTSGIVLTAFGENYQDLSANIAVAVPFLYWYLIDRNSRIPMRAAAFVILFLLVFTLILSTGRTGTIIVSIVLILMPLFLLWRKKLSFRSFGVFLIILLILLSLVILFEPQFVNPIFDRFQAIEENSRWELFTKAAQLWELNPLVGIGSGGFSLYYPDLLYPHNIFLEVLSEQGLLGCFLLIALLGFTIYSFLTRLRDKYLSISMPVLFAFFSSLFWALVSGDLARNKLLFFFCSLMVTYVCLIREKAKDCVA